MGRRTWMWIGAAAGALLLGAAAFWFFVLRTDAPDPVSLESALEGVTSTTEGAPGTTAAPSPDGVDGDWALAGDGRSFVGYRVQEELAGVGAFTAAGRTTGVSGGLTIDGDRVDAVSVTADLTGLRSDDSRRDNALRRQALETDTFPTATFTLTEPIPLTPEALAGEPFTGTAAGDLTLHGVTRPVEVPVEAQLVDGAVVVVGSLEIAFEDYDIDRPRAAIVLSVEDRGIMELQLVFTR